MTASQRECLTKIAEKINHLPDAARELLIAYLHGMADACAAIHEDSDGEDQHDRH